MSESDMRGKVIRALKKLDAKPVENPAWPGTPDVNYIGGWIELKWLRSWPKRETTPVTIDHYTPQQKVWGIRRWNRKGACYLLLQVRSTWLLFDAVTAAKIVGTATQQELKENCLEWFLTEAVMKNCLAQALVKHQP